MSDTPKLADALRSWDEAASRMETAEENLTESEASNWSADRRGGYLRGYDDARAEMKATMDAADCTWFDVAGIYHCKFDSPCAACQWRHDADKAHDRVRELEAQLAAQPQPAAVGVVGAVRWGVESFPENYSHALVAMSFNSRESAEAERLKWGDRYRVVAIVNPNSIVPLESNEPVRWIDTNGIAWDTRESAIRYGKTDTINPLYEGPAQPAQEGGA